MYVIIRIKDADTAREIPGAKVKLSLGSHDDEYLSGPDGTVKCRPGISYVGQTLVCEVEKEGYQSQRITQEIRQDDISLEIRLRRGS